MAVASRPWLRPNSMASRNGSQKLEDAITCYERGAALRKHCETKLAEAEARVAAIVRTADGGVTTRPLE